MRDCYLECRSRCLRATASPASSSLPLPPTFPCQSPAPSDHGRLWRHGSRTNSGKGNSPGQSWSLAGFVLAVEGPRLKSGPPTSFAKPGMQSRLYLLKPHSLSLSRLPHFSEAPVLLMLKESANCPGNS
ncbi:hypothetical protein EI555_007084 [Monodon monoceros]|uniref:Uncharacterized protein n=1 Tax=Monodon monoceros TaxID=40151 RepID=A0A4U1FGJ3_MONMO|nr:hypothetical protein EI555_007084 [Monodon monoceros]